MYTNIIFDLDGTLVDSDAGIVNSMNYALTGLGLSAKSPEDLKQYIGPPLADTFCESLGLGPERGAEALARYREYYARTGIFEASLYPGVADMLAALHRAGRGLFLGTSKVADYADRILEKFGIRQYFSFVGGATLDGARRGKEEVLRHLLAENPGLETDAVMVGDTVYDVEGAGAVGLDTAAVLWGYGSRWLLEKAGARWFFADVPALQAWLLEPAGGTQGPRAT